MIKKIIEDLFKLPRFLLGEGADKTLEYINDIIPLEIHEIKSGTKLWDWVVPEEWIIRDGWVKCNGEKIIDFNDHPFAVINYSMPINRIVDRKELEDHLFISKEMPGAYPYEYSFYERQWGFSIPEKKYQELIKDKDCKFEVFIDSEFKPGKLKIGVHTIKGKTEKEILLFAHTDHPWQANDNLSGVACLVDMAQRLKDAGFDHTIKLIFTAETIGSIAYVKTQDISKVDFVIAVDACGNENTLLWQKAYDKYDRLNYCAHLAVTGQGVDHRKGEFRFTIGSDEYIFNDRTINIPGIMFSRYEYKEYHTSEDTPDKINEDKIKEVQDVILRTIEIYEKDFIPKRNFKGILFRSGHGLQTTHKLLNRDLDYLMNEMDGKKYLTQLIIEVGLSFEYTTDVLNKLEKDGLILRVNTSQKRKQKASK